MSAGPSSRRCVAIVVVVAMLVAWPAVGPLGGAAAAPTAATTGGPGDVATSTDTGSTQPAATFARVPLGAAVGESVRVSAETAAEIETYEIDWGDGTTETIPTEGSHTYDSTGTYDVTLTVTDDRGRSDSVTRTITIDDAADRRVISVDESRPGRVDGDDPTTADGRHYEPVRFAGTAGQFVTVATDTEAPVQLSIRRADDGTVVRPPTASARHPTHRRVELPADGEYVVRVAAGSDNALPVGYELALSELAVEPGNESAPSTSDLGPGPVTPGATLKSEFGRDDRRGKFNSLVEATAVDAVAGDRITLEYASPQGVDALLKLSGPGLRDPAFPRSGETLRVPGNGTYSVVVSGPDPQFTSDGLPASYNLTVTRSRQSSTGRLVVDDDGGVGNYTSIEAATDAAAPGATIEVRPGTYHDPVMVDTNLTIVAPDGATLAGNGSGTGITIETASADDTVVVEGLTITGFETGVDTVGFGTGPQDWQLRDVAVVDNAAVGVEAGSGDWRIENATIARNGRIGVDALASVGTRTISDSRIVDNGETGVRGGSDGTWSITDTVVKANGNGIGALESAANWTVQNATLVDNDGHGLLAQRVTGTWTVRESTVANNGDIGIDALNASGDWTVEDTRVENNSGDGIAAFDADGDWTVTNSTLVDNDEAGVFAPGSTGAWVVDTVTAAGNGRAGIDAAEADSSWSLQNTVVRNNAGYAVDASGTGGDWRVRDTVVRGSPGLTAFRSAADWDVRTSRVDSRIQADNTFGTWTIRQSGVAAVTAHPADGRWSIGSSNIRSRPAAVDARGAAVEVVATDNWWGQPDGPTADQCLGNVTCDAARSEPVSSAPLPLVVNFTVTPEQPPANASVDFNATRSTGTSSATSYDWRFGDGTTATGPVVTHSYDQAGEFTAELVVTLDDGTTRTVTKTVTVTGSETLVVDSTGAEGNYTAIEPAVGNASDGARVVVRPGSYPETVDVGKNVTIVAPDGAEVRKPQTGPGGFDIDAGSDAAPSIRGFTVNGSLTAVQAVNTDGAWSVRNLTVVEGREAVDATGSTGNWSVTGVELLRDSRFASPITAGVRARGATGDWQVRDSRFGSVGRGVGAADTEGDWRVENVTVRDAAFGVDAGATEGAWVVADSRFDRADAPVTAVDSTDDWRVRDTLVTDARRLNATGSEGDWRLQNVTLDGTGGVDADATAGEWQVVNTTVTDGAGAALSARDSTDAWTVRRSTFVRHAVGLDATGADGDWTVDNTSVRGHDGAGLVADETTGDWRLLRVAARENGDAAAVVSAVQSAGNWSISRSTLVDGRDGVVARGAFGDWAIHRSTVVGAAETGVDARGASPTGNARRNAFEVGTQRCVGNVDCGNELSAFPEVEFSSPDIPPEFDQRRESVVLTVTDGSTRAAGLDVYLLPASATVTRTPDGRTAAEPVRVDVREQLALVDGNEHHDPDRSPLARLPDQYTDRTVTVADVADRNVTTAADGRIRFNGFADADPGEYDEGACFLVVPPEASELNVQSRCVEPPYDGDTVSLLLDDDTDWRAVTGDEWPQFQRTPANTGVADDPDVPRSDVRANWTFDTGEQILHSPVVANDTVYVSSAGNLYALEQATGDPRWVFEGPAPTQIGPAAVDGTVYYVSGTTLHAIDSATGRAEWQADLPTTAQSRASVTVADGRVFVSYPAQPAALVVFDAATGEQLSRFGGPFNTRGTPAYDNDTGYVYIVGASAGLSTEVRGISIPFGNAGLTTAVVDPDDRTVVASLGLPNSVLAGPTVTDDAVYLPTTGGNVDRLDPDDPKRDDGLGPSKPAYLIGLPKILASPAVDDGTLYVGTGGAVSPDLGVAVISQEVNRNLTAVDASTGVVEWKTAEGPLGGSERVVGRSGPAGGPMAIEGALVSSPAVANGTVFAGEVALDSTGDKIGSVVAADANTGQFLWQYDTKSAVQTAPAVDDGNVYVGDDSGRVYALTGDPAGRPTVTTTESLDGDTITEVAVTLPNATGDVTVSDTALPDDLPAPPEPVVDAVDIAAPDPGSGPATVEFTLSRTAVENPASLDAYHYDAATGTWEPLPTTVDVTDRRIIVTAEADRFSPFVVTTDDASAVGPGAGGDDGVAASDSLADALPTRTAQSLVVDGRATFSGTDVVRAVRLDEDVSGTVGVREFDTPPAAVEADLGDEGRVRTVVDVTASRPTVAQAGGTATLELELELGPATDPSDLVVLRETEDGWTRADRRVLAATDGTVTLAIDVESLSAVAVTEVTTATSPGTPATTPTTTPTPTATATPEPTAPAPATSTPSATPAPTDTDLPGFGPLVGLLALLLFMTWLATRRR
jgi:PKD repeat protein